MRPAVRLRAICRILTELVLEFATRISPWRRRDRGQAFQKVGRKRCSIRGVSPGPHPAPGANGRQENTAELLAILPARLSLIYYFFHRRFLRIRVYKPRWRRRAKIKFISLPPHSEGCYFSTASEVTATNRRRKRSTIHHPSPSNYNATSQTNHHHDQFR